MINLVRTKMNIKALFFNELYTYNTYNIILYTYIMFIIIQNIVHIFFEKEVGDIVNEN